MTTIYEFIYASLAVVMAGFAVILFIKLVEEIKAHADTAHELTKVKEELKKEKEAHMLEIQTRQSRIAEERKIRIAEERKIRKVGTWFAVNPQIFELMTPKDKIEEIIRNDMARKMVETIKPYIEIDMEESPDFDGFFRFSGQLSFAAKEPKQIDFSEAFRMVGVDPEEVK